MGLRVPQVVHEPGRGSIRRCQPRAQAIEHARALVPNLPSLARLCGGLGVVSILSPCELQVLGGAVASAFVPTPALAT